MISKKKIHEKVRHEWMIQYFFTLIREIFINFINIYNKNIDAEILKWSISLSIVGEKLKMKISPEFFFNREKLSVVKLNRHDVDDANRDNLMKLRNCFWCDNTATEEVKAIRCNNEQKWWWQLKEDLLKDKRNK